MMDPVLRNYGIDEARAQVERRRSEIPHIGIERQRNPAQAGRVYPGMTIQVRLPVPQAGFTVKEKVDQEKRDENDVAKGIVKFLVDVFDETGETVAIATILTMVKKLDQN